MKLPKFLQRKAKTVTTSRNVNPFSEYLIAGGQNGSRMRPLDRFLPSSTPSSSHSSSAESIRPSALRPRPLVDELFDMEDASLTEAFRIIDMDGDGKISKHELGIMWTRLGEKLSDQEIRLMVQEADIDGDGEIDLREFVNLHKLVNVENAEEHSKEIRVAFDLVDVDRNGRISAADLQTLMKKIGKRKVTFDECLAMIKLVDIEGDALISFQEFERLMKSDVFAHKH